MSNQDALWPCSHGIGQAKDLQEGQQVIEEGVKGQDTSILPGQSSIIMPD